MTHFYALAVLPADGELDELLAETMRPFDENREVEQYEEDGETYWRNPIGLWDWYQVGGRYSGRLSGYDPTKDPANFESCWLCKGTGRRDDELGRAYRANNPDYGCNGCEGPDHPDTPGLALKWPTSWVSPPNVDVLPALDVAARLAELADEQMPYAIFTHDSESATIKERWNGEDWEQLHDKASLRAALATILSARMKAGLKDRVVVVDYHC